MNHPKFIIGIASGFSGAIAVFNNKRLEIIIDMPTQKINGKIHLNIPAIRIFFKEVRTRDALVCIENVHAMPRQGVTSMFRSGFQLGALHALVIGMDWRLDLVSPHSWKKEFGLTGRPKEAALSYARQVFAARYDLFTQKKDVGRADAALIGLYGIHRNYRNV